MNSEASIPNLIVKYCNKSAEEQKMLACCL